ncbi:helix-turn-helix transcriptional regulator [Sunxiuqinia rutila]|uniref:helix-turn-helix transcriptional regulator n=1 Tax=Sunxiuqinia rutila TaxID=1397841 RepID=UPI003D360FC6
MAISKHPFGRYQIIDRELGRKNWVKTKELKKTIEQELSIRVSERMINEDINAMKDDPLLGYNAPIEYNRSKKAYFYTDKNYTIKAFGLKNEDIEALMFYAKTIHQYREYEVFKDFTNAIEKVLDAVTIRKGISNLQHVRTVVQTEPIPRLTGNEQIPIIIQALDTNKKIEFDYKKYDDSVPKTVKLHPYLLKEDRHRWYLVGQKENQDKPTRVYALDRMTTPRILEENFVPKEIDFEKHFAHSFGITVTDEPPIDIILSFTPYQGNYLKTLKIHPTQQTLLDNHKEFRISIKVSPSWEFYEKILGYGNSVRIISPSEIINEIRSKSKQVYDLYK